MAPIKIFLIKIDNLTLMFSSKKIWAQYYVGAMVPNCINVMKNLFMENEISAHLLNPFKLYPLNIDLIKNYLTQKSHYL